MEKVKKIVLIGASGFVGSALLNEALNRDLEVTAVVRHPEKIKSSFLLGHIILAHTLVQYRNITQRNNPLAN